MLEPAPKEEDPYRRPREEGQEPVVNEEDPTTKDRHEIERLIDRQEVRPRGRGSRIRNRHYITSKIVLITYNPLRLITQGRGRQ